MYKDDQEYLADDLFTRIASVLCLNSDYTTS